jgi:hypothetical protein
LFLTVAGYLNPKKLRMVVAHYSFKNNEASKKKSQVSTIATHCTPFCKAIANFNIAGRQLQHIWNKVAAILKRSVSKPSKFSVSP